LPNGNFNIKFCKKVDIIAKVCKIFATFANWHFLQTLKEKKRKATNSSLRSELSLPMGAAILKNNKEERRYCRNDIYR
jgi:hypothetical protein